MLRLTKRADYGMMAICYLAEHARDRRTHSARDIADAYHIPLSVMAKTLQILSRAELVASQHGVTGGYMLARPASAITTLDVISAFEEAPAITSCMLPYNSCEMMRHCIVRDPLRRVNDRIRNLLSSISIADLSGSADDPLMQLAGTLVSISWQEHSGHRR